MKRVAAFLFSTALPVSPALAQTTLAPTSPARMGITPMSVPKMLQVLDHTKTEAPIGIVDQAHKFSANVGGTVDAKTVGMQSGGRDNSPYVQKLMDAVGPAAGITTGAVILFPPTLGQVVTWYYFSQPLVLSRAGTVECNSGSVTTAGSVILIFPPGVDGVRQETGYMTPDTGWGGADIHRCSVQSLGGGTTNNIGSQVVSGAYVHAGGSGFGASRSGTMTYNWGPSGCTTNPALNVTTDANGVINAVTSVGNPGFGCSTIYGHGFTAVGGGLDPAGTGAYFGLSFSVTPNAHYVSGIYLNQAPSNFKLPSDCHPVGTTCSFGVGDGIIIADGWVHSKLAVAPGAYVGTSDPPSRSLTLAAPYTVLGPLNSVGGGIWDLPAKQKYTIQTTSGSNTAIVTAGPRLLRPGDMLWSDAFLFGTSVLSMANAIAGTPTVNTGGSGYVGGSGTMTWSGPGCTGGYNAEPVLNVTASGGVIIGVTSVANAGDCLQSTPDAGAHWMPGGGLSGGSGASFNMTFNQTIVVDDVTLNSPANAVVTHGSSSPGQMWTIPAGVVRNLQGRMHQGSIVGFGIDLRGDCQASTTPLSGCNSSFDQENLYSGALVGRLVRGDNTGVSTAIANIYGSNYIADEIEAGTIGSTYISEEDNSQDAGTSNYGTLIFCGSQNYSVFIGSYLSGQGRFDIGSMNICMGTDAQGNPSIDVPPAPGPAESLFIGGIYGAPVPSISPGSMWGTWSFFGSSAFVIKPNTATPSGSVIALNGDLNVFLFTGLGVSDGTNPAAIPANTYVTAISPYSVTISNPLTSGGVQAGDKIVFTNTAANGAPCFQITGGLSGQSGLSFDRTCSGSSTAKVLRYYGYGVNAWGFGTANQGGPDMEFITADYLGYKPFYVAGINFPIGFTLGDFRGAPGTERLFNISPTIPTAYDSFHLRGDTTFNSLPSPGGNMAWVNAPSFSTNLAGSVVKGTTTSVPVAACPAPALPVSTPIVDTVPTLNLVLGTLGGCTANSLTFQGTATASGALGDAIQFLQFRPAAPIASDPAGTTWPLGNFMLLTPVAIASLPSPCAPGTFGSVNNGVVRPAYNAPVGTTTGSATDPVFCGNGNVWTYH
jgi:hypothetical protein